MQTHFSAAQLSDPHIAECDRILRACVHCGFCTATCPTYLLTGDELDGPRGRIYLAKDMLEKNRPADATTVKHLDRCLTCLACMTTCPSGVHYMHLVDHARQHIERTYRRPFSERFLRSLIAFILPHTTRFRAALRLAKLARPFRHFLPTKLHPLLDAASVIGEQGRASARRTESREAPGSSPAQHAPSSIRRVALLPGCVQPALRPEINEAAIRLLNRFGVEVIVAKGTGCCGALVHHLGREHESTRQAKADIDAWTREIDGKGLDAIIVTASGCGTMLKDYGFIFRTDPAYAEKAKRVSALARDITEVLAEVLPAGAFPTAAPPTGALPTAAASPTGTSPTGASPTGTSPTGTSPTGTSPTGTSPTGTSPTGTSPTGTSPTGTSPTGASPSGSLSSEASPAEVSHTRPPESAFASRHNTQRVAYHSACSLQHGQKLHTLPQTLLTRAGYTLVDIPESHICCGSAGTYSLLQPEFSTQLRDRKARNIESATPDVIATGNIGCMTQIAQATRIPIVHTVELLDWATGGPRPQSLLGGMDSHRRQTLRN